MAESFWLWTLAAICNIVSRCASFSIASTGTDDPRSCESAKSSRNPSTRPSAGVSSVRTSPRRTSVAQSRVRKGKSSNFGNGQATARARQLSQQALLIFIQPRQSRIGNQHSDANSRLHFTRTGGGLTRDHPLGDQSVQHGGAGGGFRSQGGCARPTMLGQKRQHRVFGLFDRIRFKRSLLRRLQRCRAAAA